MLSKIKNWFTGQTASVLYSIILTSIIQWGINKFRPINIITMNPFYYIIITIILFHCFAFVFKYLFNNQNDKIDFEKLQNNYLPPLSYLNFKIEIKKIKGDKRFKIDLISNQNINSKIATIRDIEGNLIIFFQLTFKNPMTEKQNYRIQKTTQSSDECEVYHDENLQNVLYNIGIGNFVSMTILPIKIFIENGGEYKLEFTGNN